MAKKRGSVKVKGYKAKRGKKTVAVKGYYRKKPARLNSSDATERQVARVRRGLQNDIDFNF